MNIDEILVNLRKAKDAIALAENALNSIGWNPLKDADGYEYNGFGEVRRCMDDGQYKLIKVTQQRFYAHGNYYYIPKNGQPRVIKTRSNQ